MDGNIKRVVIVAFALLTVVVILGGSYTISALRDVERRLPLKELDRQRELSGVIQTITQLAADLDAYRTEPSERRLEELNISLDRSYAISESAGKYLDAEIMAELRPIWLEIDRLLENLDNELQYPGSLDESRLLAQHTRLIDSINAFRNVYLESNMKALAGLAASMQEIGKLRSSTLVTLLLILLSVFAMAVLLVWQGKTISILTKTESALLEAKKTIENQYDELAKTVKFSEEVERMARHDLKGVLMGIVSYPKLLLMSSDNLNERQVEIIKKIEECGDRMRRMIDISLDIFKIEQGLYKLNPVTVDLIDLLEKIISENRFALEERKIQVDLQVNGLRLENRQNAFIYGDELLCYSMVANLFKNALEATSAGGVIKVEVETGEEVIISIQNDQAIPAHIRDRFFEKYVTSGKSGGTGIGTYSAKLIAQLHDGEIAVQTGHGLGTVVKVTLPPGTLERNA